MTKDEAFEQQLDEIMDTFDFAKCRETMVKMGWSYGKYDYPPEEYDLRQKARTMLRSLKNSTESTYVNTARFHAAITLDEDCEGKWLRLSLTFLVEQTLEDGVHYE